MKTKQCNSKKHPDWSCNLIKPIDQFHSHSSLCKNCANKKNVFSKKERAKSPKAIDIYVQKLEGTIKKCPKCLISKPITEFRFDGGYYRSDCRFCENDRSCQWKLKHKKEIKNYNQKYKQDHKEEVRDYNKKYSKENKETINIQKSKREHKRRAENPEFKLRQYISIRIGRILKSNGGSKEGHSTLEFLPYTARQLKEHIENLFEPWMNWNNYGKYNAKTWNDNDISTWIWQIDHIIPQSVLPFKSMKEENFLKCWALDNLRPFSAKQNYIDGATKIRHQSSIKNT